MSFLALLMGAIITGNTVIEYGKQPLDINMAEQVSTQQVQQSSGENQQQKELPFLEGKATWYDYKLGGKWYSKYNDTCALRIRHRGGHYKVCAGDKCVVCRHNDYGPAEYTNKVIDLSSHAFKQLAPLSRGVIEVQIYKLD